MFAMNELTFETYEPSTALERSTTDATHFIIQTEMNEISQTEENKAQIGISCSSKQTLRTQRRNYQFSKELINAYRHC